MAIEIIERLIMQIQYFRDEWFKLYARHDSVDAVSLTDLVKRAYRQKLRAKEEKATKKNAEKAKETAEAEHDDEHEEG